MRYFLPVLLLCFTPPLLFANKKAIVIGVGTYPKASGLSTLVADYDTEKLQKALENVGYDVLLINCIDQIKPTSEIILSAIGLRRDSISGAISFATLPTFLRDLGPEDDLFFHFGGHGITNQESADCIIPYDAIFDRGTCKTENRLISIDWIKRALSRTGASVIISVDACRQDIVISREVKAPQSSSFSPIFSRSAKVVESAVIDVGTTTLRPSLITIKSAHPGQFAHEIPQDNAGVYTYFLIKLLTVEKEQELADNSPSDGIISLTEATEFLQAETTQYVDALPPHMKRGKQQPAVNWEGADREKAFLAVETKKLSDPQFVFQASSFGSQYNQDHFNQPFLVDPDAEYQRFFKLETTRNTFAPLVELAHPNDQLATVEYHFNQRFLVVPALGIDHSLFYQGIKGFEFYFPKELLDTLLLLQNGRHTISITNAKFSGFRNATLTGVCTYKIEKNSEPLSLLYKGRKKQFKVWKISQSVNATDENQCAPLRVKIIRTYWVLQNTYDPIILKSEAYQRHFIVGEEIPAHLKGICWGVESGVKYQKYQLEQVFLQNQ